MTGTTVAVRLSGWRRRRARQLRRLRLTVAHPARGLAALRAWIRRGELGVLVLAIAAGVASGVLARLLGGAVGQLHILLFGEGAEHGVSAMRRISPLPLLLLPAVGGLVLGLLNLVLARWYPRTPVDPIEANALHGGNASIKDGVIVAAQNVVSNGGGASVGLEAAYAQVGAGIASRLGRAFGVRRSDLRLLVGCGAAGAIAASFDAPLTGAFYAFELVIGIYALSSLAPVLASAVAGTLAAGLLDDAGVKTAAGAIGAPDAGDYVYALLTGLFCGLLGIALMRGMSVAEGLIRRGVPWQTLRPAAGGLLVGGLAIVTPGVLSSGHGVLHDVLLTDLPFQFLLVLVLLKALASAISIGSGFRGGLFFASILLGAIVGKLFAAVTAATVLPTVDSMLLSIVGMSAFGAAVIGAPLAMTFLALETTRDFAVAGPVLVAVVTAAIVVRRLFGYSFATWRFHLRGEAIRGPHDVGWIRDLTVGKVMRRNERTIRADTRLSAFTRDFPLGSSAQVVVVDEAGRYAGMVQVAEAHGVAPTDEGGTVSSLLHLRDRALLPAMNVKEALALFEAAEADVLAVLDGKETRRVIGIVTEAHLLRRYGEELDRRRRDEAGIS
ncbi:chloride channel protein [Roseomonas populi]|uniref:Chloride channel protein n=1 Tax=Roseomonas populi TaxID=3121582 RepID=A0ABT1WYX9_9PROT|nr:chloride channel protein [Roseomonas pecuniae]MCR0981042.1 chloride channel protein [Roseomonas pecuniae]